MIHKWWKKLAHEGLNDFSTNKWFWSKFLCQCAPRAVRYGTKISTSTDDTNFKTFRRCASNMIECEAETQKPRER